MKAFTDVLMLLAVFLIVSLLLFGISAAITGENESTGQSIEY